jgi:AcrR family transcriptional regulator
MSATRRPAVEGVVEAVVEGVVESVVIRPLKQLAVSLSTLTGVRYSAPMPTSPRFEPVAGPAGHPAHAETETDGRRLRRDRNRDAVVDALLTLYNEGNLNPSADEIAARSGVSARSLFRYFDDVDDLCESAIQRQQHRVRHLLPIAAAPTDHLDARVAAFVHQRAELFEAIESVATVSRLRAPFQLVVADRLTEGRRFLRQQLADLFATEFADLTPSIAASRLAAADVATSFETWRLLRDDQQHSPSAAAAVMADALEVLLTTPTPRTTITASPHENHDQHNDHHDNDQHKGH